MESRKVPASHGWMWIRHGYWLFKKSPLLWMVLTSIGVVGIFSISIIPVVGDSLSSLLMPPLLAGFMFGCHALAGGEELELAHLFSGFKRFAPTLVALGGISLVLQFLILGVMMLSGGSVVVDAMLSDQVQDPDVLVQTFMDASAGPSIILGLTLFTVLLLAMQFAPMLIIFRNMAPLPAMRTSLRACMRNMLPLMAYSVLLLPFAIMATKLMMLGWLVLLPVIIASLYAIYRDIFPMEEDMAEPVAEEKSLPDDRHTSD
jgi:hypothetical protein